jgi:threonylcarbamoyladenosine tRNA methylthiotransferase MtaB
VASFAVKFLGCKASQADAMLARRALLEAGHTEAPEAEADLHVINTCCITSEAESKSRQSVRRSLRTAREVHVAGCAVNLNPQQFGEIDARVRAFVGTADDVAAAIGGWAGDPLGLACADTEHDVLARERARRSSEHDVLALKRARPLAGPDDSATGPSSGPDSRTRGFVKVQDGCDAHCAYCIIPAVRGAARSRPAAAVLHEVRRRVAGGQPEMVMTGISVGDYRDPERGLELGELMVEVARVPGVERVRLSSVEVIHVKDSLLAAIATEPKVCPHLHVPMQSGDDSVLAAMGRHYTADEYLEQIAAMRAAVPGVNVSTDVIIGFPTEDEAALQRTIEAIDAAGITRVHTFSYSPRPGTAAASLGDLVPAAEKKRRSQVLRGHAEARSRQHRAAKLGRRERVLIDKLANSQCSGYTADYTRGYLAAGVAARAELVDVVCEELHADGIRCRLV